MKKLLLSILTLSSLVSFAQWAHTANYSAEDCITFGSKVYASSTGTNDSLRVSSDEGFNWAVSNTGIPASTPISFAVIHNGTSIIAFSRNTSKIYYSSNGSSWTAATTTAFGTDGISGICSVGGSTLLACVSSTSGKIYRSTDNGATWSSFTTAAAGKLATCIEYMNGNVFVGYTAAPKLLISTNAGATFTTANTGIAAADAYITALGSEGSNLYCGTYYGKIYKSTNNGGSWTMVHAVTAATSYATFINDFYTSGTNIFAATDTGFVYSLNSGTTWNLNNSGFNTGVYEHQIMRVTSSTNYFIVASKAGSGRIMRRPINEILAGIKENYLSNLKSVVFPNPAGSAVTIETDDLMFDAKAVVKISDALGKEVGVYKMTDGKTSINLQNFAQGLYSYRVYNENIPVSNGKLIVE